MNARRTWRTPMECSRCKTSVPVEAEGRPLFVTGKEYAPTRPGYERPDVYWTVEGDYAAPPSTRAVAALLCPSCVDALNGFLYCAPANTAVGSGAPLTADQADHLVALVSDLGAAAQQRGRALARTDLSEAQRDEVYGMWARATDAVYAAIRDLERPAGRAAGRRQDTDAVASGPTPAVRERFTVFAGPPIPGSPGVMAWCEAWTVDGHSVLPTAYTRVADAVRGLRAANPDAVVDHAVPARGAQVLALAAAGGHFAVDGDPACTECAGLSRPAVNGQDHDGLDHDGRDGGDVEWCRICDEQPAQPAAGDGLCGFCRGDVAEGRRWDPQAPVPPAPNPAGRAIDGQDHVGRDHVGQDDDAGSVANRLVIAVCLVGIGVLLAVDRGPGVVSGLLWGVPVELAAIAAWWWRRAHGICRACGHRGSAGDPLTALRRPRVHIRHLPNVRASHAASRRAARAARDDAAGCAS